MGEGRQAGSRQLVSYACPLGPSTADPKGRGAQEYQNRSGFSYDRLFPNGQSLWKKLGFSREQWVMRGYVNADFHNFYLFPIIGPVHEREERSKSRMEMLWIEENGGVAEGRRSGAYADQREASYSDIST